MNIVFLAFAAKIKILNVQSEHTSATVTFSDPAEAERKELEYSFREVHDGQRGGGRSSRFLKFKQPCFPGSGSTGSASPVEEQQSEERRIPKLKAGRNYFLKLRADYGKEGAIESDEFHLYTQPYEGI